MNKLEELEKQYLKLGEEIERLKKGKEEKYFIPKEGDQYYHLDRTGYVSYYYDEHETDKKILERQIPCRTEEEAEFYDQKRIYETDYRKHLLDHEEEPIDWKDDRQNKYYAYHVYDEKRIGTCFHCEIKVQGTIYTTREESIYEFAKEIGEDNFIKYILIGEYKED